MRPEITNILYEVNKNKHELQGITDDPKSYTSVWFDYQASIIAATPMRVAIPPNCIKEWESTAYCGEEGKCLKCITK